MMPFAFDGTTFDLSCRYPDGFFRIGRKGAEMKFKDYRTALVALLSMAVPRWRRPNKKGHFGIVRARTYR